MSKCKNCGEFVDWNNPNIHYGGHTCDPIKVAEYNLEKLKEEKNPKGVYDFNGMKDDEISRLKNAVYEQGRMIFELKERCKDRPTKRSVLSDGTILFTKEEIKEFADIIDFKKNNINFEMGKVYVEDDILSIERTNNGIHCDWIWTGSVKAIKYILERFYI